MVNSGRSGSLEGLPSVLTTFPPLRLIHPNFMLREKRRFLWCRNYRHMVPEEPGGVGVPGEVVSLCYATCRISLHLSSHVLAHRAGKSAVSEQAAPGDRSLVMFLPTEDTPSFTPRVPTPIGLSLATRPRASPPSGRARPLHTAVITSASGECAPGKPLSEKAAASGTRPPRSSHKILRLNEAHISSELSHIQDVEMKRGMSFLGQTPEGYNGFHHDRLTG